MFSKNFKNNTLNFVLSYKLKPNVFNDTYYSNF